ncbi:OLC1v1020570C1 [Oldenlandia corymbosa var. corymbosa]|uniref:OLC1v1020570C1 n=1 Tax=Oldenlandia corymbosa var. corymbosa TaxID=529605 RepID=A0AAV1EH95_OLDCO|nr:OLC1v1020570C1 [Oldenlandia corymbosa var. corymbosa]
MNDPSTTALLMNKKKKTTQGRKKIEIKKIDKVSSRQVTFSKRRAGLFRKASELCILTGAEVAIIVESAGKRLYTFGHPNVDVLADRFMRETSSTATPATALFPLRRLASSPISAAQIQEHNFEFQRLTQKLEDEKKKIEQQEKANLMNFNNNFGGAQAPWWEKPIEDMGLEDLELFATALEELKNKVLIKAEESELLGRQSNYNADFNPSASSSTSTMMGTNGIAYDENVIYDDNGQGNYHQYLTSSSDPSIPFGYHNYRN